MSLISRRILLVGIAAAALGGMARPTSADTGDIPETLLSIVGDPRDAAALGQSWINQKRSSIKPRDLANQLADLLRAQGWSGSKDPVELRQRFNAAVKADYQNGETVTVAGWQLAKTQAELCALAYYATAGLL
jgi:hypothetical protein